MVGFSNKKTQKSGFGWVGLLTKNKKTEFGWGGFRIKRKSGSGWGDFQKRNTEVWIWMGRFSNKKHKMDLDGVISNKRQKQFSKKKKKKWIWMG